MREPPQQLEGVHPAILESAPVIASLLLAAGESTRMGQLKALLPWRGTTLLQYCLGDLPNPVVVLGHRADELAPLLTAPFVINERYREGRATSIAAGMAAVPADADAVVIASVDQPRPRAVIDAIVAAHRGGVTRPVHRGEHGHPPVFGQKLFGELRAVGEESEGMKSLLRRHPVHDVEIDDPIVLLNLNTPEEYARAFRTFGSLS
jgi:molybdenum cofactor cytidylyltransferase